MTTTVTETETETRTRSRGWTPAVLPIALLLMALGAWVFFAPLVGPMFGFGLDTVQHWRFSSDHWTLSLLPGIAIFVGGLLLAVPTRVSGWLAGLIAVAGGVWLVIGPTLHPTWSSGDFRVLPGTQWRTSLRWIGDLYGAGALAIYLGALAQGMLMRRATVVERVPTATPRPATVDRSRENETGEDETMVQRPVADGSTRVDHA